MFIYTVCYLEQIQEIWHDTVSRLVWLQSRGVKVAIFRERVLRMLGLNWKNIEQGGGGGVDYWR